MKVFGIFFGPLKNPGTLELYEHYRTPLQKWVKLEEVELKIKPESSTIERLQAVLDDLPPSTTLVYLSEHGESLSTEHWASRIDKIRNQGNLAFVLGPPDGFGQNPPFKAKYHWSLGPQTLSHELARIVWVEQIFRSFSILHHHPYHRASSSSKV